MDNHADVPELSEALADEVEALRALYGDENITFNGSVAAAGTPATIAINLEPHAPVSHVGSVSMSTQLPARYPDVPPCVPTLSCAHRPAAECALLIDRMLRSHAALPGEVCLFEYCEQLLALLAEAAPQAADNAGGAGTSSDAQADGAAHVAEMEMNLFHGEPLTDRKSVFQCHVATVTEVGHIDAVLSAVKAGRKGGLASHTMVAYRISRNDAGAADGAMLQDCDDDGEKGGSKCMLYVLQQMDVRDVVVVVSRWFGGIKLGPVRFRHIGKVVREGVNAFYQPT